MQETCAICGKDVPYSVTVHVLLNPSGDEGVRDDYVCRSCYEADLEPLFEAPADAGGQSGPEVDPADPSDEEGHPDGAAGEVETEGGEDG